jgi:hypothetical protein
MVDLSCFHHKLSCEEILVTFAHLIVDDAGSRRCLYSQPAASMLDERTKQPYAIGMKGDGIFAFGINPAPFTSLSLP